MTALGKGRTATTTGKRKHKEPVVEPVYMSEEEEEESVQEGEEDEEEEEDESVTRCTCGESHSVGLMVQCDQCEVWQHCECMGLEEQDIPDQYYCEECRPTDHIEIKVGFEKTRRYYKPALPSNFEKKLPKRRTTLNSREASDSWEEILALQNAIEQSKSSSSVVETLETPENQVQQQQQQQQQSPSVQSIEQTSTNAVQEPEEIEAEVASPRIARQKRTVNGKKQQQQQQQQKPSRKSSAEKKAGVKSTTGRKNNTTGGRKSAATKTARSRTSTPQPAASSTTTSETTTTTTTTSTVSNIQSSHLISPSPSLPQPSTPPNSHNNHNNHNNNNNNRHHYNHHLFEQLSQSARETSPPAKVRLPSVRMTIPEMNRRANQILEYICSIQVEMATGGGNNSAAASHSLDARISEAMTKAVMQYEEEIVATAADNDDDDDDHDHERPRKRHRPRQPTPILIPEKLDHSSPSSSLSSASTIPLEESDKLLLDEKSVAEEALDRMKKSQQQQSSTEIMDLLTRQVINFQRRFGPLGGGYEDESSESDGPTTRSRDLNRSYTERAW